MIIATRQRFRIQSVILLFVTFMIVSQSGCTANVSSVRYQSDFGDRNSFPGRANISVNFSAVTIHGRFQDAATKRSIANTITQDLDQNIFYKGDENKFNVVITLNKIAYSEEKWYYLSWMIFPFYLYAMPIAKSFGEVEATMEVSFLNGDIIGSYRSAKSLGKWYNLYNFRSIFPSAANQGGITKDALKLVIEDLKYKLVNDRQAVALANNEFARSSAVTTQMATLPMRANQPTLSAGQFNVAVIALDAISISRPDAVTLTNRLRVELFATGRFVVLERAKMKEILEEQGFQETGCTTSDCLVEVGQLLNMEQMISGSVSKIGNVYSIELRIFDVATGVIVGAAVEDITGSLSDVLTKGIRNAATKLAR